MFSPSSTATTQSCSPTVEKPGAMRSHSGFGRISIWVVGILLMFTATATFADPKAIVGELIQNQRRILILREVAPPVSKSEATRAGQFLFVQNQRLTSDLIREIVGGTAPMTDRYREFASAMDNPTYADEDRLVLRHSLDAMARRLGPDDKRDAEIRLQMLSRLRDSLGSEFEAAFQHMPLKREHPVSPRWNAYLRELTAAFSPGQILSELDRELSAPQEQGLPEKEVVERARVLEWNGEELPDHTVLLTFDDGPHPVYTPLILDILKQKQIHALFFQVGHNLGEIHNGLASPGRNLALVERIVAEGHAVGNHSFSHPVLPRLAAKEIAQEIADTQLLLDVMVPEGIARTGHFRPPYGARDDKVLEQIDLHHLRSVIWNIDSEDWADPLPASIAHRIVSEAEKAGRGIVLMHDIHARSVDALPLVIEELRRRGFRFAHMSGRILVTDDQAQH